ncbi:uncharacterized protein [Aegilops tauschii subsp. strangulata]|uniref:uncharacterized protein n=1 Tax=Aegilops tauschii subsp. strangulata TaxID=200361 RepID=UPI00098BAFFC|nr:uncharacterized protein LOC109749058 [Aegilops tauschii subsp. strangulata]
MALVPHGRGSAGGSVSMGMPVLAPDGYTVWAIKAQAILDAHTLREAVAPAGDAAVNGKKCKTARAMFLSGLPEDVLLSVATKPTAREVWDSLKVRFVGAERVRATRRATLRGELDRLKMEDGESLDAYAGRLVIRWPRRDVGRDGAGEEAPDTVPDRLFPVVAGIEQFCVLEELTYDEALGWLRAFDERWVRRRGQSSGERADGQLLYTAAQWRAQERQPGGARDDDDTRSQALGFGGNKRGRCYKCGERGHFKRDCPQLRKAAAAEHAMMADAGSRGRWPPLSLGLRG